GGSSHPSKRLREDHGTPSEAFVGGKSMSAVQRLLAGAVLNAEVRGKAIPTLPFVTSFVSAKPKPEDGDHTDSVVGLNLRTISAPQRFVISSDSSHHSGANVAEAEVDSLVRSSVPVMTDVTTVTSMESDQWFNVGVARQMSLSAEVRMRAEYNVKERRRLKSVVEKQDELLKARDGEIEDLKAQLLLKETKVAKATHLC
ncbi:hypothetical protein Tco_1348213, partial [Tanacetum coccineum]